MSPPAPTASSRPYIAGNWLFNAKPAMRCTFARISLPPPGTKIPSGSCLFSAANIFSKLSASRTSQDLTVKPRARARSGETLFYLARGAPSVRIIEDRDMDELPNGFFE